MTEYISEQDHEALKVKLVDGSAIITIPRNVARKFYTRVTAEAVHSITGQSIGIKKVTVWLTLGAVALLFLCCLALIAYKLGWVAAMIIPLVGIFWTILIGLTGDKGGWIIGNLGLGFCLSTLYFLSPNYSIPISLFGISVWLHRFINFLSQYWLQKLVTNSYDAFDMLVEHIHITTND